MKNVLRTLLMLLSLSGMTQTVEDLSGLWVIEEVKVGNDVVTPNARWTRLNADLTHESGNGWFQHSYGTWSFDKKTREIQTVTLNGTKDSYGPFKVNLSDLKMTWEREEEGMNVVVILIKSDELPATYRDQLLGLWKLEEAENDGSFYKEEFDNSDYLHIRWDGKFVVGSGGKKMFGVYNVHGHKSEIELIPYGEQKRSFWSVKFLDDGFEITKLNEDRKITRRFKRINSFP